MMPKKSLTEILWDELKEKFIAEKVFKNGSCSSTEWEEYQIKLIKTSQGGIVMPDVMKNRDPDVFCKKGIWTLVSINIIDGYIGTNKEDSVECLVTYRRTGGHTPTDMNEGLLFIIDNIFHREPQMHFLEPSDIYVMPKDEDLIICIERENSVKNEKENTPIERAIRLAEHNRKMEKSYIKFTDRKPVLNGEMPTLDIRKPHAKHIFTENAPQFFGCPEYFTADQVTEMRRSFKAQKITAEDLKPTMGKDANKCLSFDYDKLNYLNCAQWTVRDYSERDDNVILDFVGTAG